MWEFFNSPTFTFIIVPIFIFIARILDVSIGTVKLIFITRGYKKIAPFLGFIEVFIWIIAMRQIFLNLTNWWTYFAYAAGFATGTYVGMVLEERISMGKVLVRIITKRDASALLENLKQSKYTITAIDATGTEGNVKIIFTVIDRKNLLEVIRIIKKFNPHAFYTIEDIRFVSEDGHETVSHKKRFWDMFAFHRTAK
ncbi:MAG: DUF2179 domain-containing protein [Nanoarchaeota archaeon]|nr:DUF2179 domain-containing protein [Nanoarchaeota archaeon]